MLQVALTTENESGRMVCPMENVTHIHRGKQPNRPHFIKEWAEHRGFAHQNELAVAIGGDKSLVSRWLSGASPTQRYQEKLAELFACDREALFRHPDDDWVARFLRNRSQEERRRMMQMLEAAFPMRTGTDR
jgi:transcriptional regulator with XRE-family HTH domain